MKCNGRMQTPLKVNQTRQTAVPTLLAEGRLVRLALGFGLPFVGDLAGHGAGHVELVDVQAGLAEGRHGGVHACIAVGRAAERGQVQGLAPCDDGDVERELAAAVGRGRLGDGEGRRGGELAAGARRRGRLAVQKFAVLAAGEEELQRTAGKRGFVRETIQINIMKEHHCNKNNEFW